MFSRVARFASALGSAAKYSFSQKRNLKDKMRAEVLAMEKNKKSK